MHITTEISTQRRHRSPQQRIGVMVKVSRAHDRRQVAEEHRHRPPPDLVFLDAVARRLAEIAVLPLATAKARVQAVAVSAGGSLDPGGDARWWKAPRSKP